MAATGTTQRALRASKTGPLLKVSRYDTVTAVMIATALGLLLAVGVLIIIWLTNRIPEPETPPQIDLLILPGGDPDGAPDETLNVESPEDPTDDPSVVEEPSEEMELQEMLDQVMEISESATQIVQEQTNDAVENSGNPGSAVGTGRKPLGMGDGTGGFPSDQRWFIRFADKGSLESYAKQLDFFKIELGALLGGGRLIYMTNISAGRPTTREVKTGKDEKRLYMNWQGGDRRQADIALFKKAGIDASLGLILHFYPKETEQLLLRIEQQYKGLKPSEIRRTYFDVRRSGNGFEFVVTKQFAQR